MKEGVKNQDTKNAVILAVMIILLLVSIAAVFSLDTITPTPDPVEFGRDVLKIPNLPASSDGIEGIIPISPSYTTGGCA